MSTTMLCQVARAENPFYLEDVDMHIGSIEELCYYLQNHLPLVDITFFSMHLLDWIEGELGAVRLAQTLHHILTEVPDPTEKPKFKPYWATITSPDGKSVNFHRGKGEGYANVFGVGRLAVGTSVYVLELSGKWAHIQYGNFKGWVYRKFTKRD